MRTDIFPTFFSLGTKGAADLRTDLPCLLMHQETQNIARSSNTLTLFDRRQVTILTISGGQVRKRPELELFAIKAFTSRHSFHSFSRCDFIRNDLLLVRL